MKKSWTFITLLAALAAGGASAQVTGTPPTQAGTEILNKAEITFTPEGGSEQTTPSNEVKTTVLPVPSFTITPNDGSTDVTKPDYTQPGQTAQVKPCDKNVSFLYTLTNTGNVPNETYVLSNTPDPTGAVKTPDNIRYYPASADTNTDGKLSADEIAASAPIPNNTITIAAPGGSVKFFQVYDIPCTALDTDKFGGDPTGTRQDNPAFNNDPSVPQDANNSNTSTVTRNDSQVVGPKNDANADNKDDTNNTANQPYTNPSMPGDTTPDTVYPGGTTVPGTTTPVPADTQQVIAPCTSGQSVVTFVNTVQNTGNRDDVINITAEIIPPNINGLSFTLLKMDGTALSDTNGDGKADVGSLAPNAEASFLVRVTYDNCLSGKPTVVVTSTSSNNPSITDQTKDELLTPVLNFGDHTDTPGDGGNPGNNPNVPVTIPDMCTAPINTVFPMDIANIGTAPDLYNVSGSADIKLKSGTVVNTTIQYYLDTNNNGTYEAGTDTPLTDTNGDGIADTGLMQPGQELRLIAILPVPCDAAAQTITLNQTAKSPTTGVTITDNNDTVTVGQSPVAAPVKAVDKAEAKPGDILTYTIMGKNTSNGNITKAMVCDTLPANTSFVSWTATSDQAGTVLYSNTGGSTWSTTAPTTAGTKLCAAVDTNGDGQITTADILAPGKSINVTYQVKVN